LRAFICYVNKAKEEAEHGAKINMESNKLKEEL